MIVARYARWYVFSIIIYYVSGLICRNLPDLPKEYLKLTKQAMPSMSRESSRTQDGLRLKYYEDLIYYHEG